jgi:predicted membrane-bound spermidine synthase
MAPHFLSFCIGFLSLSQEILWIRFISFTHTSTPFAFSFVLGCFILGISLGSTVGKRLCERNDAAALARLVWCVLLMGAAADLVAPWAVISAGNDFRVTVEAIAIIAGAAIKSVLFPVAHHLGTRTDNEQKIGSSVSRVYVCNIVGSSLGPVVTGFILLDLVSTQQAFISIALGQAALAIFWGLRAGGMARVLPVAGTLLAVLLLWLPEQLFTRFIQSRLAPDQTLQSLVENKHGVIHTVRKAEAGKPETLAVYGGNVYDGTANIGLADNTNGINRAYILAALHPAPRRILVVGLSTGAWTKVLSAMEGVERIDVIEINPGYLQLTAGMAHLNSILTDPRIHIHIDDGRRWMRKHPNEKYDLIVQNTSHHWRSYSTTQLSYEYQSLVKSRLNAGGLFAYNSTLSMDAFRTSAEVFSHSTLYANLVVGGDRDFVKTLDKAPLGLMRMQGKPIFKPGDAGDDALLKGLFGTPFVSYAAVARNGNRPPERITDANLITEFKYGLGL